MGLVALIYRQPDSSLDAEYLADVLREWKGNYLFYRYTINVICSRRLPAAFLTLGQQRRMEIGNFSEILHVGMGILDEIEKRVHTLSVLEAYVTQWRFISDVENLC